MTAINHLIDSVLQVIIGMIPVITNDQYIITHPRYGWSSCLIRHVRDDPGWSQYICSIWSEDRSRVIHRRRTRLCHPFCRQISRFHRYLTARQCANSHLTTHVQVITGSQRLKLWTFCLPRKVSKCHQLQKLPLKRTCSSNSWWAINHDISSRPRSTWRSAC